MTGLIFVLQEGPERGWTAPVTLAGLGTGLLAAVGFVAWELHRRDASLLDVRLFRHRGMAGGSLTLVVVFGVQAGVAVVLFPYLQAVLGWSGLLSTVAMMPMAVVMMAASGLAPGWPHGSAPVPPWPRAWHWPPRASPRWACSSRSRGVTRPCWAVWSPWEPAWACR
ncbi:hypothetical protein QFZ63_002314 [Streptomyces sp. B3I7]|nr:hypothetical protein [Streptomyces sp. B3I7]